MKYFLCWCFLPLIVLVSLSCAHYHPKLHKRFTPTEETSTKLGLGLEDKEELQEALELLNMGKQSFNLPTEDTQLLIQLVDPSNATDRSDQIQKFVQESFDDPSSSNEKQYMALSGEEGRVNVNNYSVVTPAPEAVSSNQNGDVQDIFKMVVRKKDPGAKDKAVHKITIIETNRIKPFSNIEPLHSKRKKRVWSNRNSYNVPLDRQKRTKDDPLLRFLKGEFSKNDVDDLFDDKVNSGGHSIKIRDLFNRNELGEKKSRLDKSAFGDNDFDGELKSQFREPYLSWMKPSRGWEPSQKNHKRREAFHAMRHANRKQRIPLTNPTLWTFRPKHMPGMDEDNEFINDDVDNIDNIFKSGIYETYIPSASEIEAQVYPRADASLFKRSNFHEGGFTLHSKPNIFSQSPTTASSTISKNEKTDHTLDGTNIYNLDISKYSFEKPIIFSQEKNAPGTTPTSILRATTFGLFGLFMGLLGFTVIVLACSSIARKNPRRNCNTLELRGAHVTLNVTSDDLRQGQLHFKTHTGTFYRKFVDEFVDEDTDDLIDLEWQSEVGEWLSDQGSVRNAIAFEKL